MPSIEGDSPVKMLSLLEMTHEQRISWLTGVRKRRETRDVVVISARQKGGATRLANLGARVERLAMKLKKKEEALAKLLDTVESIIVEIRAAELEIAGTENAIEVMHDHQSA